MLRNHKWQLCRAHWGAEELVSCKARKEGWPELRHWVPFIYLPKLQSLYMEFGHFAVRSIKTLYLGVLGEKCSGSYNKHMAGVIGHCWFCKQNEIELLVPERFIRAQLHGLELAPSSLPFQLSDTANLLSYSRTQGTSIQASLHRFFSLFTDQDGNH